MRFIIKLFSLSFLVCAALYVFSGAASAAHTRENNSLTYLVVGFDSSPANTDVLCVVSYDSEANTVRAVQIPRDTAIKYKDGYLKINALYSRRISEGSTRESALEDLSNEISGILGVNIDGYVAITTKGLADLVDFLGGIYIHEEDIPKQLKERFCSNEGRVLLDGKGALDLVRYRADYTRGDLERLDTQKKFIKSLATRVGARREIFSLLKFASDNEGISFDINKGRSLSFLFENVFRINNADLQIATLPGVAIKHKGVWYYVVNREKSIALIQGYFPHYRDVFDKNKKLVNSF